MCFVFPRKSLVCPKTNRSAYETSTNDRMNPPFAAVVEATKEAAYNSISTATHVVGRDGHSCAALPIEKPISGLIFLPPV